MAGEMRWHPGRKRVDVDEVVSSVLDAIREHERTGMASGSGGYHYVRIYPWGQVISGHEAFETVPESEYYCMPGAPLTVWSHDRYESAGAGDGVFEWDEVGEGEAPEFWGDKYGNIHYEWERGGIPSGYIGYTLSDRFTEEPDLDPDGKIEAAVREYFR